MPIPLRRVFALTLSLDPIRLIVQRSSLDDRFEIAVDRHNVSDFAIFTKLIAAWEVNIAVFKLMCFRIQTLDLVQNEEHKYSSRWTRDERFVFRTFLPFFRSEHCHPHCHLILASTIIMSFSISTASTANFTPELDSGTLKVFGVCALRRHVLDNLQSTNLTQAPTNLIDTHDQTGGDHGQAVRRKAGKDLFEGRYYARKPQEVISMCWPYSALLAECSWLCTPMDFRTFRASCTGKCGILRTEIAIELFPRDEFINPPPELDDPEATHPPNLLCARASGA